MAKKKLINLSKEEENINGDCQSIEELKGWRFNWRKIILLEPTAELIILVLLALLYGGFYYYDHYTVNEDNIYGLWQSDHHKLAISYKHIRKRGNIDWQVVQDGKYIIYAARTRPVKRLNDGTLHMELYTVEGYLTDLPIKDGFSYMDFYLRKNNYLTYDGESYKRINSGNKSITWKDGSTSPYGERKTTIDEVFEALYLILMGICSVLIITEARQKRREKLSETPIKKKYADRKKLNRKYHSQKAYRKEQKRKTGWRALWDKFTDRLVNVFMICFLLMIPIFIVYMIFFDDGVSKDGIYGLWQSENHKLAISYEDGSKGSKRDWDIVQDGNVLIKNARIDDIKRLEDGTLYIEVYAKESLFSDLPTKNGYNYLNMYVRKDDYLTYDGESYKLIDDENKSITWKDGSKSLYGQRITLFDRLKPYIVFGIIGSMILYAIFVDWRIKRNLKRKNRLNEASTKEKIR